MNGRAKETIKNNLGQLADKRGRLIEKEIAHIGDIALFLSEIADDEVIFFRDENFVSAYKDILSTEKDFSGSVNENNLRKQEKIHSEYEKALLCRKISDLMGIRGIKGIETFFEEDNNENIGIISYFKGVYADEAYLKFSTALNGGQLKYANSFAEACEDVYHGKAEYCIIPDENGSEGKLGSFRAMAEKYSLKTAMKCRIKTSTYGDYTVFALMTKGNIIPKSEKGLLMSFDIGGCEINKILLSADICNQKVVSVFSTPKESFEVTISVDGDGICGFLTYLFLEKINFTVIGLYNKI